MARLHLHLAAHDEPCHYLPGLRATTEYRVMTGVSPEEQEALLSRGWRRFGAQYFRPVCAACAECVSLRVPVATFEPTKSQRRAWRKCQHLRVEVRTPCADPQRLALYHAWHAEREQARGWPGSPMDLEEFARVFCLPHQGAREMDYFDGEQLVAVGFVDETPQSISSIYFFYHPQVARLSLGVASALFEIEWARQREKTYAYFGYRIAGCPSTAYKSHYGPHELLTSRPGFDEAPAWHPAPGAGNEAA
ncbi:MAG: leucyl-tRNA---protein transferase [Chthoniobacter sp.]|nr:leucyl-tRNA---protein transferase [Chthoniobacter sp.]